MVGNMCMGTDAPDVFAGFMVQPSKLKCYMEDTGLLLTLAAGENYLTSELYKSFMLGKISVNKGMMTENIIAQILSSKGHHLYFYENIVEIDGKKTKYEVDFLISEGSKINAFEIKSSGTGKHESILEFSKKYSKNVHNIYLLSQKDVGKEKALLLKPFYLMPFLI